MSLDLITRVRRHSLDPDLLPSSIGKRVLQVFAATPFASWAHLGEMEATTAILGAGGAIRAEDMPKCQGGSCAGSPTVYRCEYPEAGNCLHQIRNSMKQHGEYGGFSLIEREEAKKVHRSDLGDTRDIVERLDAKKRLYKVTESARACNYYPS